VNDDLVLMKCTHPAHRHKVPCRIRVVGSVGSARTIVLTNPDGRLRFPNDGDTTKTLTVPSNGSWVSFEISGETGSAAIGDAVIEAHCDTATGALSSSKSVTVVWFDQAKIDVNVGGAYSLSGDTYKVSGANAVDYQAEARIRPAGVDCSAPQIGHVRIGILQNEPSVLKTKTWGAPTIAWNRGVAAGTTVTVSTQMRLTIRVTTAANDSEPSVAPLYDQPGKRGTIDEGSLTPPKGCTGAGTATSSDAPETAAPPTFIIDGKTPAGTVVGRVTYTRQNVTVDTPFITWAVAFNTSDNHFCLLRERTWRLNVDSAAAGPQKATAAATDADPAATPAIAPPFANANTNNPANHTTAGVGAATTSFTK
jgi:hypothetical protein